MFSLYLAFEQTNADNSDLSKIWLGGYDRPTIMKMAARYDSSKSTESMSDQDADDRIRWLPLIS